MVYDIEVYDKIVGSRVSTAVPHVSTSVTSKSRKSVLEYPIKLAMSRKS